MSGHHVSTGHKENYSMAYSGQEVVQLIESAPDSVHWLIVRDGKIEQKIALSFSSLLLLCKAVSIHPIAKRLEQENP